MSDELAADSGAAVEVLVLVLDVVLAGAGVVSAGVLVDELLEELPHPAKAIRPSDSKAAEELRM